MGKKNNKDKLNKKKHIIRFSINLKLVLILLFFGFLLLISYLLYKQQREEKLNRLEIEKQNIILAEEREKKRIEEERKIKIEECQTEAESNHELELASLEAEKESSLGDFYSTQQYLEAKQDLEASREEYEKIVETTNINISAICNVSDRAFGESPVSILTSCQNYKERAYAKLENLKFELIDEKEAKIVTLKSNYFVFVENKYEEYFDALERSLEEELEKCASIE